MKIVHVLFGTIVIALLGWFSWLASNVFAQGLNLTTSSTNAVHAFALIFTALFIGSVFSGHMLSAHKVRALYKFLNTFTGLAFYLFPAAVAVSLVFALGSFSADTTYLLCVIAFCAALLLGIIGLIQARFIKTTHYTVTLPGAPASWNGKVAALVSDTHFGLVNHAHFSHVVVREILRLNPDFVLHAGDFYDGPTIRFEKVTAPWKTLAEKKPVFYTPGNHELYGNFKAFVDSVKTTGATVLIDEKVLYEGVQIAGIGYRTKNQSNDAALALEKLDLQKSIPSILINHPPTFHHSVARMGVTLMVSGHTHGGQFWPINYLVWLLYKKFIYGCHQVGALTAITTRGVGTAGPPTRLFCTPEIVLITFKTE